MKVEQATAFRTNSKTFLFLCSCLLKTQDIRLQTVALISKGLHAPTDQGRGFSSRRQGTDFNADRGRPWFSSLKLCMAQRKSRKLAELAGVTLAIASFSLRWGLELAIDI